MDDLRALARAARAAGLPAWRSSPGTPRWSSAAPPTACTSPPRASAVDLRALDPVSRAGRLVLVSGGIAEHGIAVMIAAGTSSSSPTSVDTTPLHGSSSRPLPPTPISAACATLRGAGSRTTLNELATGAG